MFKNNKSRKLFSVILTLGLLLSLCVVQSVYATNGATNKAINVLGYLLDVSGSPDILEVYLDKNMSIDTSDYQFKVVDESSTEATISNVSYTSGSGVSSSEFPGVTLPNGCTVTLSFSSALAEDEEYTVTVSRTIRANNSLTVGDFIVDTSGNKIDRTFVFRTPDSGGAYTGNPKISEGAMPINTCTGVPVEGNVGFIVDRPINNNYADVISGMTLEENNATVVGTDCYPAMCVASHTGFFFPLTYGGTETTALNLRYSKTYEFGYPDLVDDDNNTLYAGTIEFSTTAADIPGKISSNPTYNSGTQTISWGSSSGASSYNIYRSSSKYWDFEDTVVATGVGTTSYYWSSPVSGSYVRIEAVNSYGKSGLSMYVQIP